MYQARIRWRSGDSNTTQKEFVRRQITLIYLTWSYHRPNLINFQTKAEAEANLASQRSRTAAHTLY